MKKDVLTLTALLFLSALLVGQNLTRQEMIEMNRTRVDRLVKNNVQAPIQNLDFTEVGFYKLDSIISGSYDHEQDEFELVFFKDIFSYDDYGNTESATFYYRFEGYYFPSHRIVFASNDEGNIVEELIQGRNSLYSTWDDYFKIVYHYDSLGRMAKEQYYEWYSSSWDLIQEKTYHYYPYNLLEAYTIENFGYFEDKEKREYTYDKHGNIASDTYYAWNSYYETWDGREKTEYVYNDKNQLVSEISYRPFLEDFLPYKKDSLVYDEEDVLIHITTYMYNDFESFWQPIFKENYQYGSGSKVPTIVISEVWTEEMEWKNAWKDENLLDDNENVLSRTAYSIRTDSTLRPYHLYVFDRNNDITLNDLNNGSLYWLEDWVLYNLEDLDLPKGPNAVSRYSEYYWNPYDEVWEYEYSFNESFLHYSTVSTTRTEDEPYSFDLKVYPNPVDRLLTVETNLTNPPFDLYLYNMLGQRVFRKNVSSNEQVVLPNLAEGMYVLQLSKESQVYGSRRIIIRH